MERYDSSQDTLEHKNCVLVLIQSITKEILKRGSTHDDTKLEFPEKEYFDEYTPKLANSTYLSDEYKRFLAELKPALDHHYAKNSHHPEHYQDGMNGMDLIDLIEMLADWYAAAKRHNDGDIMKSIELNKIRFGYGDMLMNIFKNTVSRYFNKNRN
jgi:hypothetical protein